MSQYAERYSKQRFSNYATFHAIHRSLAVNRIVTLRPFDIDTFAYFLDNRTLYLRYFTNDNSLLLKTSPEQYPAWTSTQAVDVRSTEDASQIKYKYIVMNEVSPFTYLNRLPPFFTSF